MRFRKDGLKVKMTVSESRQFSEIHVAAKTLDIFRLFLVGYGTKSL